MGLHDECWEYDIIEGTLNAQGHTTLYCPMSRGLLEQQYSYLITIKITLLKSRKN